MNLDLFKRSPAGDLLRSGHGDSIFWSFFPNPLAPQLDFDSDYFLKLSEADRALGELAGWGRNMPNPQFLIQPFIREEAVVSSRIEGTEADITELYAYEVGEISARDPRNTQIHSDVRESMDIILFGWYY